MLIMKTGIVACLSHPSKLPLLYMIQKLPICWILKTDFCYYISGHLIHRFGISEADWHRIKQNMDSKCRTAFRRKQRGMPLTVKAFRGKSVPNVIGPGGTSDLSISDEDSLQDSELHIHQVMDTVCCCSCVSL